MKWAETVFSIHEETLRSLSAEAYKHTGGSNIKFYKMVDLCKLGIYAIAAKTMPWADKVRTNMPIYALNRHK